MDKKLWDTPSLNILSIRSNTQASFPPGAPDNFATSDSLCPGGNPPTSGVACAS